jgi:hypothetical protein
MCPYCGNNSFQNSWGFGNARCTECEREFIVERNPDSSSSHFFIGKKISPGNSEAEKCRSHPDL